MGPSAAGPVCWRRRGLLAPCTAPACEEGLPAASWASRGSVHSCSPGQSRVPGSLVLVPDLASTPWVSVGLFLGLYFPFYKSNFWLGNLLGLFLPSLLFLWWWWW